jgi:hypothetical protein
MSHTPKWIGYRWLAETYGVKPVQSFRIDSKIASKRTTEHSEGYVHESYPSMLQPADTLQWHLTFALKREGIHLEFLARLFDTMPVGELEQWVASEPSGQYARRAGFFYEWLTGRSLAFSGVSVGNYVNALDEDMYLTAVSPANNPRWRVRDNLPGTPDYCPLVLRTDKIKRAEHYDVTAQLRNLEAEYGEDLLQRSAIWLTIKESQASFMIEHEDKQVDRIKRFAAVMEHRCGEYDSPLDESSITALQREILGPGHKTIRDFGLRKSPIFVGEDSPFAGPTVHYIAPHWNDCPAMLGGLRAFAERTVGKAPLLRAAVLSFGFVYIHPMADGNGRISRFLINDVLRRDGALPAPFILPVSAMIASTPETRRGYDQVLESFSKPFMRRYQDQCRFGQELKAEDGIRFNLHFSAYADAAKAWRYPDLTTHTEYLAHIVDLTLDQEMRKEARYLRSARAARDAIKEIVEGPDSDIDRIIRSVRSTGDRISNKLRKGFPFLDEPGVAEKIVGIVHTVFDDITAEELEVMAVQKSQQTAERFILDNNANLKIVNPATGCYIGPVVHETEHHFVQDIGCGDRICHEKSRFSEADLVKAVGSRKPVKIQYHDGKGTFKIAGHEHHGRSH